MAKTGGGNDEASVYRTVKHRVHRSRCIWNGTEYSGDDFQIVNAVRNHDTENIWFSNNGVAGLVFYGFLVLTVGVIYDGT